MAVDLAGKSFAGFGGKGERGAHVHPRKECLVKAAKSSLARSFKTKVVECTADDLALQIVEGSDRRITGLLSGAWRARMRSPSAQTR